MRPLLISIFILLSVFVSKAQQYHFIYLQTENKQPFYIKVSDKIFSSSAYGYVVLPKLQAGSHTLSVGFPKNEWPSQNITINVENKDLGYILKNFDSKGWGLFNLQTMEVVTASSDSKLQPEKKEEANTNQFSSVLADVVNTPSIKEGKQVVPILTAEPQVKKELKKENIEDVVVKSKDWGNIQKISSAKDEAGLVMLYIENSSEGIDTIGVFIPIEKSEALTVVPTQPKRELSSVQEKSEKSVETVETAKKPEENIKNPTFIEIELPNPNAMADSLTVNQPMQKAISIPAAENSSSPSTLSTKFTMINSDCKQIANQDDFLKIRKKMTAENSDDDMVKVAKKMLRQKCYSTEQIKNLSVLFLKDDGKYKLFDAAYPFVHDSEQFKELESQLSDSYFITRFRAMIRK
jgi:hypothetical protein